jgi:high-affinity iron transporter
MNVDIIPGFIVGLREGLEAFLIITVILEYLNKTNRKGFKKTVLYGTGTGIAGSVVIGLILRAISSYVIQSGSSVSKLWESLASLAALIFISTFIYWMIVHGHTMVEDVKKSVDRRLSSAGVFILSVMVVLREGAEISLFAFTALDKQAYTFGILIGIVVAGGLAYLVYRSLVRLDLRVIFRITLVYLILQAGYLLGYSVHELLSALKDIGKLAKESPLLIKVYDFKNTIMDHKTGTMGVLLNVLVGWYSRPEILQFVLQVGYVAAGFSIWKKAANGKKQV